MRREDRRVRIGPVLMLAAFAVMATRAHAADDVRGREALQRARRLVDVDAGVKIVLIDPELAPDPETFRHLDAFIVREPSGVLRPAIYINRRSEIVRQAAAGSDLHVSVLAAVIHHEARHLAGASEAEARRAELEFFRSLVVRGDVSPTIGLRYLRLLARRADDRTFPSGRDASR